MAQKVEGLRRFLQSFVFTEKGETELMRQLFKQKIQHYIVLTSNVKNRVRISLHYIGSRQFEEAASEGIKQPQIVCLLTGH